MPDRIDILPFRGIWRVFLNGRELGRPFASTADAWRFLAAAHRSYCAEYGVGGTALGWNIPDDLPPESSHPRLRRPKRTSRPRQPTKQERIDAYILSKPGQTINSHEIASKLHINRATVWRQMNRLKHRGLLEKHGERNQTTWTVSTQGEDTQ